MTQVANNELTSDIEQIPSAYATLWYVEEEYYGPTRQSSDIITFLSGYKACIAKDSYVFVCPVCGKDWARIERQVLDQRFPKAKWETCERTCPEHGGGNMSIPEGSERYDADDFGIHFEHDRIMPIELLALTMLALYNQKQEELNER